MPLERESSSERLEAMVIAEPTEQSYSLPTQILVVDDDPDIRTVLFDLLESEGYHITEASTAHEALHRASTNDFDAVLLDIGLPDLDGLTVLSHLHASIPTLPVIMLTAAMLNGQWADSLTRGAFSCFPKPFDRDQLRLVIRLAVGRS